MGEICSRFTSLGLEIKKLEMALPARELLEQHYAEHKGKPFYEGLLEFVSSGPIIKMLVYGLEAVQRSRQIIKFVRETSSMSGRMNLIHGSDSLESAQREIGLWFPT